MEASELAVAEVKRALDQATSSLTPGELVECLTQLYYEIDGRLDAAEAAMQCDCGSLLDGRE